MKSHFLITIFCFRVLCLMLLLYSSALAGGTAMNCQSQMSFNCDPKTCLEGAGPNFVSVDFATNSIEVGLGESLFVGKAAFVVDENSISTLFLGKEKNVARPTRIHVFISMDKKHTRYLLTYGGEDSVQLYFGKCSPADKNKR